MLQPLLLSYNRSVPLNPWHEIYYEKWQESKFCRASSAPWQVFWIDSVRIVQDDPKDWSRESGLMMKVYEHLTLNIGASSAKNGTFGCSFGRNEHRRCQIQPKKNAATKTLYDCVPDRSLWPRDIPLHKRAWVVQERFMSRRMVHFYKDQVFWSCNDKAACETFPDGYPQHTSSSEFNLRKGTLADKWSSIVLQYSSGELTRSSDKLVALGGLAQSYQAETKDQYLAGMWRTNLEEQPC